MIVKAGLWVFAGKLGSQLARLLLVMVMARLLTPEAFGVVAAVQVVLAFAEVIVRFGVGAALIQTETLTRRLEGTALLLVSVLTLVICVAVLAFRQPIATAMNIPELVAVLPVTMVSFALASLSNPSTSLLARDMRFKALSLIEIGTYVFGYGVVAVVLALLDYSYWALVIGTLVQTLARTAIVFWMRPIRPVLVPGREDAGSLLSFGGGVFLAQMLNTAARRADNIIVSTVFGAAALGVYSRAYTLMNMSNTLLGSVFRDALFSGFSKKRRKKSGGASIEDSFLMAQAFAALIILPISAGMVLLADEVIFVMLGPQWDAVVPLLQAMGLGMYFRLAHKVSGSFNLAAGLVYGSALRSGIYAFNVILFCYLGSGWGLIGVAYGVVLALACHFTLLTYLALSEMSIGWLDLLKALIPYAVAGLVATAMVVLGRSVLTVPGETWAAIVDMAVWFMSYCVVLFPYRNDATLRRVRDSLTRALKRGKGTQAAKE